MSKIYCLLILLFLIALSGCSNPVGTGTSASTVQTFSESQNPEFYIWKMAPFGNSPAVKNAFVDIYKNDSLVTTIGPTDFEGKINVSQELAQGSYFAVAYTLLPNNYPDYYGYINFSYFGEYKLVKIQVFHS